jgi:hypothetical protein|tara:strand:+ start:2907 stop:3263 length:357 start_codon:yes stop_codon:yes gene_type:complete
MHKKVREVWVKALRSGEYEQCNDQLCSNDGKFCCLGVLIDVQLDGYWEKGGKVNDWEVTCTEGGWSYQHSEIMPPKDARESLGLSLELAKELSVMNDEQGKSFKEIANYIESNFKEKI